MSGHPILFIPGPTEVDEELRQIMSMPLLGHRNPVFVAEVQAVCKKLEGLFLTSQPTFFENAPATALMEAGLGNLVTRGGRLLHLTCGAFSERWFEIAQKIGRNPDALAVDWGAAHGVEAVVAALGTGGPYEAVCVTHNETSTGVIEPLAELAAAVRAAAPDTLILVDAVSSLAGAELRFDDWGLDLAFAGTQKCLALPPGLCVFAVSERAMKKVAAVTERGYLLDFERARRGMTSGCTVATPSVPLVFALSRQLDRIAQETLEGRWARHRRMQEATLSWGVEHGFPPLPADPAARSPTVSCLAANDSPERDVPTLAARAAAAGFTMDRGYGKLENTTFRIGHMGDHTPARLDQFLSSL